MQGGEIPDEQLADEYEDEDDAERVGEGGETLAGEPDLEDAWKPIREVPGSPAGDEPPARARDKRAEERT